MTDHHLRRQIAERLGWRATEHVPEMPWQVVDAEGYRHGVGQTADHAWANAFSIEEDGRGDWLLDVNAALKLVGGELFILEHGYHGLHVVWRAIVNDTCRAEDEEPARAICLAWLAWKTA